MKANTTRITEITVPHLAESLVAATVGKWLRQPGDRIEQFDIICELLTEKVNVEMPSPLSGKLIEILVQEGETAEVGAALCLVEETVAAEFGNDAELAVSDERSNGGQSVKSEGNGMRSRYSPAVNRLAALHNVDLQQVTGTGMGGRITRKDMMLYIEAGKPATAQDNRQLSEPVHNNTSPGPGYVAEIIPSDVPEVPVRSSGLHLSDSPRIPKVGIEGDDRTVSGEYLVDITPVRNAIASKMRQSVTEIPHAWTMIEVDVTNLVLLRNKLKDDFIRREGFNLTYLAFLLKAVVSAIKDYPIMNSVWAVDKIIVKKDINISLAVGTEDSVLTPVIHKADQKNIAGLAQVIDELGKKSRAGKLSLSDMQGGTFTVNNTGSFGSILSYPIINYPQAAIVTFESIVKRPVVIQDMIAVRSMANLCLSLDHRILDGVICGRFLQRVKENLESYNMDTKIY